VAAVRLLLLFPLQLWKVRVRVDRNSSMRGSRLPVVILL